MTIDRCATSKTSFHQTGLTVISLTYSNNPAEKKINISIRAILSAVFILFKFHNYNYFGQLSDMHFLLSFEIFTF